MDNRESNFQTNQFLKIPLVTVFTALILAIFPWFYSLDFQTPFTLAKLLIFQFLLLVYLAVYLKDKFHPTQTPIFNHPLKLAISYCFLSILISTLLSFSPYTSILGQSGRYLGFLTYLFLFVFFVLFVRFTKKTHTDFLIWAFLVGAAISSVYAILQFANLDFLNLSADASRVNGGTGHPLNLGLLTSITLPLIIYLFKKSQSKLPKLILIIALLFNLSALFLSGSRSSIFAAFIISIPIFKTQILQNKLKIAISSLILITALFSANLPFIERSSNLVNDITKGNFPDRISWMISSLQMFSDSPIYGLGVATFRDMYNSYRRLDYNLSDQYNSHFFTTPEAAHSEPFNTLATQGLLGLISLAYLIHTIRNTNLSNSSEASKYLRFSLSIFGVNLLFQFFTVFNLFIVLILIGLLAIQDQEIDQEVYSERKSPLLAIQALALLFVILQVLGTSLNYAFSSYYAQKSDETGKVEYLTQAIKHSPFDYKLFEQLGDLYFKQSKEPLTQSKELLSKSILAYENSIKFNPFFPSIHFKLGLANFEYFSQTNDPQFKKQAFNSFEIAQDISPNNPIYTKESSRYLEKMGYLEEAIRSIRRTIAISPNDQDAINYLSALQQKQTQTLQLNSQD